MVTPTPTGVAVNDFSELNLCKGTLAPGFGLGFLFYNSG